MILYERGCDGNYNEVVNKIDYRVYNRKYNGVYNKVQSVLWSI